ncbi:hypothetical protein B0T14DRAFT_566010 [Immersiella caudata]|uniref:Uncharacterized protein n=1 Tax=Immersiella caudata TaxID=314043 RepID=A0AA39WPC3_9PEZI|nr:hypothetical protein B0T14DRAFT_566010 [Immersiella caudata]
MSSTPPAGSDPQNGSEETQVSDGGSATAPPNAVQQQPDAPTIADLLLEIRETNKILRALVTQKALSTDTHPQPDSAVGDAPDGEDTDAAPPLSSPPVGLCATTDHAREARDSLWRKASQLTDEMIRAVFEMEPERAVALRDSFFETLHPEPNIQFHISLLTPEALKLSRGYMMAVPILLTPTTGVLWAGVPRFQGSYHSDASSNPVQWEGLPAEIQSALEKAWPLTFKVEWTIHLNITSSVVGFHCTGSTTLAIGGIAGQLPVHPVDL